VIRNVDLSRPDRTRDQNFDLGVRLDGLRSVPASVSLLSNIFALYRLQNVGPDFDMQAEMLVSAGVDANAGLRLGLEGVDSFNTTGYPYVARRSLVGNVSDLYRKTLDVPALGRCQDGLPGLCEHMPRLLT